MRTIYIDHHKDSIVIGGTTIEDLQQIVGMLSGKSDVGEIIIDSRPSFTVERINDALHKPKFVDGVRHEYILADFIMEA